MGALKVARIFIVAFGWFIIVTTSQTSAELFKSTVIFMLGLLYDYLCIYNKATPRTYQRGVSLVTLIFIFGFLFIGVLGIWGILIESPLDPSMIALKSNTALGMAVSFKKSWFCWCMIIIVGLVGLEFSNPLVREQERWLRSYFYEEVRML